MSARAILLTAFLAAGLPAAMLSSASADSVTATVIGLDSKTRTIQIDDTSYFDEIPASVKLPDFKIGDEVTNEYEGNESAHSSITSVATARKKTPIANSN